MAVNIHITIIELNALHTKRQNLFQELDAVIHLLMEAKHWGLRKSRNATSLNSRFKSLDTLKVKIIIVTFRRVIRTNHTYPTRRSSDLATMPAEVAFGMATRANLQSAIDKLTARGVTEIVAVPLFVSSQDRKSTRLNSSHSQRSYAVICLKKKTKIWMHENIQLGGCQS